VVIVYFSNNNIWVLNVVAFLTIFNILGYLFIGKLDAVLYFILFALLVRYFSKNMTIVLGIPLLIINLLFLTRNVMEGMENKDTSSDDKDNAMKDNDNETNDNNKEIIDNDKTRKDNNKKKKEQDIKPTTPDADSDQELMISSVDNSETSENIQQGFETGRRKNRGHNIDYAKTVEEAYDELNNILGSEGIQRLTTDTQNLMKQQAQLAKSMEGMTKLVQNIQPIVGQLEDIMSSSK
jgi:hypothetical protein